jgi:RND family efflux transporter MFP subunit
MKKPDWRTVTVLAVSISILAAIGIYSHRDALFKDKNKTQVQQPAIVQVQKIAAGSVIRDSIVQNTSLEAVERVQVLPRVTGRLEKLYVRQGERVTRGQTIATLEHVQQDALIGSTRASVASAHADSERARAEMSNAKTNVERYGRLLKEGFSTQQQYDSIETAYESAKASYNAALAKEQAAQADLGRVQSTRGDYIMKAPISGVVLNDYSLTTGAMISPSSPVADVADLRWLKATLKVPEASLFAVKKGLPVRLKLDALPSEEFEGRVSRMDQYVDPQTRTAEVEVLLDNGKTGGRLLPGMFGQASVITRECRNTIVLPESAVHSGGSGSYVFAVENKRAKLKNVSTGIREGNTIQITKGLEPGEDVIVFGGANLSDGDAVSVQGK